MEKSFNNPFAANPEMKFGLSPDPSIVRPEVRMQENRAGVQRVPQRPYAYQGGQRPMPASNSQNAANRGYRVPTPAGTSRAGAVPYSAAPSGTGRAPSAPASGVQANMQQPAAGYGRPANNQTVSPDKGAKVSAENQDKAGSMEQAKVKVNTQPRAENKAGINMADGLRLDLSGNNLLTGIVMSEVLGRPKCFRRGRW